MQLLRQRNAAENGAMQPVGGLEVTCGLEKSSGMGLAVKEV
ncbi:hypothetical protein ACKF11_01435 [Methylobacillus sp. Pita2]|nr:hypothetical protein [Methylobacillus flagellatus]